MKRFFSRMSIVKKMVLGYFVIIFVPVITFGFYHNHLMYQSMIEEYASGKQQVIEQSYANLRIDLLQIASNYGLFQHNANVIDYLNGVHRYNWEYVYSYQKYIKPLLSGMLYGNDHIRDIRIYKASERVFTAPEHIIDMEALPSNVREELAGSLRAEASGSANCPNRANGSWPITRTCTPSGSPSMSASSPSRSIRNCCTASSRR